MSSTDDRTANEKLGDEMKEYEHQYEQMVPGECAFIIRCDGHGFSKFTRGFHEPFDQNFKQAMIMTMSDCLTEFKVVTGYTHSDEITLIFAPMNKLVKKELVEGVLVEKEEQQNHMFNGRVCKMLSLVSSYVSVRFNMHLGDLIEKNQIDHADNNDEFRYSDRFLESLSQRTAYFDSRIMVFPPDKFVDIARHMIWRSLKDCTRNCISTYARQYFSNKELCGKHSLEMIEMMKEKEFDYDTMVPEDEKIGTYAKKELYEYCALNPKTGNIDKVMRGRIITKTMRVNISNECVSHLLSKYDN